jgi:hypothetical protein
MLNALTFVARVALGIRVALGTGYNCVRGADMKRRREPTRIASNKSLHARGAYLARHPT